jgi:hypothetical protein
MYVQIQRSAVDLLARISVVSGGWILRDPLGIDVRVFIITVHVIVTSDTVCVMVHKTSDSHNVVRMIDMSLVGKLV